jgi:hypothetical protein
LLEDVLVFIFFHRSIGLFVSVVLARKYRQQSCIIPLTVFSLLALSNWAFFKLTPVAIAALALSNLKRRAPLRVLLLDASDRRLGGIAGILEQLVYWAM